MQSYIFFRNQTTFATILPQISLCLGGASHRLHGSAQNFLLGMFSHRFHRSTQMLLTSGGALVSSAPTEQEVHQPSKQWFSHRLHRSTQNCLLGMFSHRFHRIHRFTQKLLTLGGIKTRKRHAPKGQKHIAQGSALGKYAQH